MAGPLNDDKRVLDKGRQDALKEEDGVVVGLRDANMENLIKKLEKRDIGEDLARVWTQGNADRQEWLTRQQAFLDKYDEFIDPIYDKALDWSSTLHLPVTFIVAKTYHARMFSALLNVDPPFTVRARHDGNADRAPLIQELMRYCLKDWCNEHEGIEETIDRWIWDWCTQGVGILKARWCKKYSKFVDVETVGDVVTEFQFDEESGESVQVPRIETREVESPRVLEVFNGPLVERVAPEDLLIVGGDGDPHKADYVIQECYLTASDLWSYADQGIFKEKAVEKIIESGEDLVGGEPSNEVKQRRTENAGQAQLDKEYDKKRYQILESYVKYDLDGSGIDQDLIIWIHKDTREILRATYLYRVMPTGTRPFFKVDFHKRQNSTYGVGLVELLYSLNKEMDAMHNIRVDTGILTSLPWGYYRPSSSMTAEEIPVEPGTMIPVDDPQRDVFFPNLGNRTSFGLQEEQGLNTYVERLTSVSDLTLGIIGGQGATRTATGTRAIVGETNANLDVFLKRLNRGFTQLLKYLFHLMQVKLPPGFQFRILGDDGSQYWQKIESPSELSGMYDFELDSNSSNSNPQIQQEKAAQLVQITSNPLYLQIGIVSPINVYEALKNQLQVNGIRNVSRYITKPQGQTRRYTPEDILKAILAGVDLPLDPTQDLEGIINFLGGQVLDNDDIMGQLSEEQAMAVAAKLQEAQQLLDALEQQRAQVRNQQQVATNSQIGSLQSTASGADFAGGGNGGG